MLADAVTAYCYDIEVYTGKHGERVTSILGLSARVVNGLTKTIQNRGHIVYTDNFYTSPLLAKTLASQGINVYSLSERFMYLIKTYACVCFRKQKGSQPFCDHVFKFSKLYIISQHLSYVYDHSGNRACPFVCISVHVYVRLSVLYRLTVSSFFTHTLYTTFSRKLKKCYFISKM